MGHWVALPSGATNFMRGQRRWLPIFLITVLLATLSASEGRKLQQGDTIGGKPDLTPSPSPVSEPATKDPLPAPSPSPSPSPPGSAVFTRCPLGCAPGACVGGTGGGYSCNRCLSDFVLNTNDGTCGCPAGRHAQDDSGCADCPKGSYCLGGRFGGAGVPAQVPCGVNMTTLGMRTTSVSRCVNMPGSYYVLPSGAASLAVPSAVTCPADTYCPGLRKQRAPVPCPSGTTTGGRTGAISVKQCGIPPGFQLNGPGVIVPCARGTYKPGTGPDSCQRCARGVTTLAEASTSLDDCKVLRPGFAATNFSGSAIIGAQSCPQKFYCPGGIASAPFDPAVPAAANTAVVPCPNGTWTPGMGASSADQCLTPPGFRTANGTTVECADGSYRAEWLPAAAAAKCNRCGLGFLSEASDMVTVYALNGSTSQYPVRTDSGSCYILAGQGAYYSSASKMFVAVDCANNNYGAPGITMGLMPWPCMPCPAGMFTSRNITASAEQWEDHGNGRGGYKSSRACVTKPGMVFNGRMAVKCPAGSWAGADGTCISCPFGFTTPDNANNQTSLADCKMAPGFGLVGNATGPCPTGTYSDVLQSGGPAACTPCPTGTTTAQQGADSVAGCNLCASGYSGPTCGTQCGGGDGATFGPPNQPPGVGCFSCPDQSTGFMFFYGGSANLFSPAVVARAAADSPADCLSQFVQIEDTAWFLGGNASLTPVNTANGTFEACTADCAADAACQYITYDYSNSTCWKKVAGSSGSTDLLAFKAVVAGDVSAASRRARVASQKAIKSKALASGSYTFWRDDATGIGTVSATFTPTRSYTECLAACDEDSLCAAAVIAGMSNADSVPTSCSLIRGDNSIAAFKRSVTKAVVSQLTPPELPSAG